MTTPQFLVITGILLLIYSELNARNKSYFYAVPALLLGWILFLVGGAELLALFFLHP